MLAHQDRLPSLPVPSLETTLKHYLRDVRPLVDAKTYEETERAVADFRNSGQAAALHEKLKQHSSGKDNWLSGWWLRGYLRYRLPVPIHVSPSILYGMDPAGNNNQVLRATKLTLGALRMEELIASEKLPVDMVKGSPICMAEYKNMFGTCRIPGSEEDMMRQSSSDHIVVLHRKRIYTVPVRGRSPAEIASSFAAVLADGEVRGPAADESAAMFTSWGRSEWAVAREELVQLEEGKAALEVVETALFAVALDDVSPKHESSEMLAHILHGSGSDRWYDKGFNIIVCKNGAAAVVFEHSVIDALPILRLADYCLDDELSVDHAANIHRGAVKEVVFPMTRSLYTHLTASTAFFQKQIAGVDTSMLVLQHCNGQILKKLKVSPDGFAQVALQLAFYRSRGYTPSTYEAGSMKHCKYGRTETIRSASVEATDMCRVMARRGGYSNAEARPLIRRAISKHVGALTDVKEGRGVDRHLLALSILAEESGGPLPRLFSSDRAFEIFRNIEMTTSAPTGSQRPGAVVVAVFGPVAPTGVGVCYLVHKDRSVFAVTSFNHTASAFTSAIREAVDDLLSALVAPKM